MRVAYIGNFEPTYSTENEILHALGMLGVSVMQVQENDREGWVDLAGGIHRLTIDAVIWTSTISLNDNINAVWQFQMLDKARRFGVPTIGVHLDRWWGLEREHQLERPFFACEYLYTADGGHQEQWESMGINHRWFPPGVSERWCRPGMHRAEYDCDVLFVGNWVDYGHRAWKHRLELVDFLSRTYGGRFLALPRRGHHAIRGLELNDVYWSAKVVVGDSCLVPKPDGSPMTHYCSDRVPETLGRGGILVHPRVEGVTDLYNYVWWELGDWADLRKEIDGIIIDGEDAPEHRQHHIDMIKANHTYTVRMRTVLNEVMGASL